MSAMSEMNGVFVLDKPIGLSSMRAVAAVRRRAGGAKTGHAGTLDPLASGVLVLALGRATKVIERIMRTPKRYQTTIDLSAFTTTDDREGERTEVDVRTPPTPEEIERALPAFTGEIMQRPPAFSAMKIGGRRAYALARRGDAVELPARPVVIYTLHQCRYAWPELEVDVHCGKGVYIRSLARDLGAALGTGGHCAALRRTAVGPFDETVAVPLDQVPDPLPASALIPVEDALEKIDAANIRARSADSPE